MSDIRSSSVFQPIQPSQEHSKSVNDLPSLLNTSSPTDSPSSNTSSQPNNNQTNHTIPDSINDTSSANIIPIPRTAYKNSNFQQSYGDSSNFSSQLYSTSPIVDGFATASLAGTRHHQDSQTFHIDQLLHLKDSDSSAYDNTTLHTESLSPHVGAQFRKRTKKKLVIAMIGLPARGKTYISKKISRWLKWTGYHSNVFNIGNYRRKLIGYFGGHTANFFDPYNSDGAKQREECANMALNDMFYYFKQGGHVGIYDGTNSTNERRSMVIDRVKQYGRENDMEIELVWIESICNDDSVIEANIRETKLTSPDYTNVSPDSAVRDFRARIANYEKLYESLPIDSDQSYVKIIDAGRQVHTNKIQGYLMSKLVSFIINIRINHAPIYITRHGESQYNTKGWIGGDSHLTDRGQQYAKALAKFIYEQDDLLDSTKPNGLNLSVWSSTLRRTIETASALHIPFVQWQALKEIQVGICDSMTYEEIENKYPDEALARKQDKLHYRYPQGESYMDLVQRLEPVIMELERVAAPILVVCHRAVARCLYSYFLDEPPEVIPHLDIPLHTVMKLQPKAYSCLVSKYSLGIPSVESSTV